MKYKDLAIRLSEKVAKVAKFEDEQDKLKYLRALVSLKKLTWFSFVSQCCLWFNLPLPQFWRLSLPLLSLPLLSLPCLSVPLLSLPVTGKNTGENS